MDAVESKVRDLLISEYGVDADQLQAENGLVADLHLDSIELVQLALDLEEAFGVELQTGTITASMTVGEVCDLIRGLSV